MSKQRSKQTSKQISKQPSKQTSKQTSKHTSKQTSKQTSKLKRHYIMNCANEIVNTETPYKFAVDARGRASCCECESVLIGLWSST